MGRCEPASWRAGAFGGGVRTEPYRGQMISIHDARTLNCSFPALQACCWLNQPAPVDNLKWVVASGAVDDLRTRTKFGADSDLLSKTQPAN